MTKVEVEMFIEQMEEVGDVWEKEDVERVYGNNDLQEALDKRMGEIQIFAGIIDKVLNR